MLTMGYTPLRLGSQLLVVLYTSHVLVSEQITSKRL